MKASHALLLELIGDIPVSGITKNLLRGVKKDLRVIPPRVRIMRDTAGKPLRDIIKAQHDKQAQYEEERRLAGTKPKKLKAISVARRYI